MFHDSRLNGLLPLTQFYVRRDAQRYALVDLYYPQLHLAIEIDEPHHANYLEADKLRQEDIERASGCSFHRIDIAEDKILDQIESLKRHVLEMKDDLQNREVFEEWTEPKSESIEELQRELKNTLFVKIRGKIPEDTLLERQTGAWRLADWKRKKVLQVVVVHDGVVARAFKNLKWWKDAKRGNKWAFTGDEADDLNSIGSLISGWNYQATTIYSSDIG